MSGETLDAHVDACDGGPPAQRYRPQAAHGMEPPLEEVTLHVTGDPPHWHLVTRGLSELDAKQSPDRSRSGWGFELTLRLPLPDSPPALDSSGRLRPEPDQHSTDRVRPAPSLHWRLPGRRPKEDDADWAVNLLTNVAAYVWTSRNAIAPGHHVDLGGPIRLRSATPITAAAVVTDPGLGTIETPFGTVEFLQVVGLHADELELCRSWSTEGVIGLLAEEDPWLVTRLDRPSLLADPRRAQEIERRAEHDGASLTELRVATLQWSTPRLLHPGRLLRGGDAGNGEGEERAESPAGSVLTMGSGAAAALGPALRRELVAPGATFAVVSDPLRARFTVADTAAWRVAGETIEIDVPLSEVEGLAALFDGRTGQGRRPAWPGLRFRVVS